MGQLGKRNAWRRKRAVVLARDEYTCQYCLKPFPQDQLTLDHVVPRYRGGTYAHYNLVAACCACQQRKDSKTINQIDIPDWQREALRPESLLRKMKSMDFTPIHDEIRRIYAPRMETV
jgi:5-methylcytosine-specific restriction endonuclease McrA